MLKALCVAVAIAAAATVAVIYGPGWSGALQAYVDADRTALRTALKAPEMAELRLAYAARDFKPIWIEGRRARPETQTFIGLLTASGDDGLDPQQYETGRLTSAIAGLGDASRADKAQTELLLSRTYVDYISDLHTPMVGAEMIFTDADLGRPGVSHPAVMAQLAKTPSLSKAIEAATRMNPLYVQHRAALRQHRKGGAASPAADDLLRVNLERLRALPVELGTRFILVDTAAGKLWLYENGRPVDSMKVIVGTPQHATPMMAGMVRYAMFNPSWNVPPDLTQATYAPRFQADLKAVDALHMDVWSDHTKGAYKLDPETVDWGAIARGGQSVWLRQRPGGHNSMGAVKFMMPNELGIYLHDTPNKDLFASAQRTFSAGCVRVEDYKRLARWLYNNALVGPRGPTADQRIDLPTPTPVYITYLTAAVESDRVVQRADVYHRDPALLAQVLSGERHPGKPGAQPTHNIQLRRLTPVSNTAG